MLISETNITITRRYRLVSSLESLKFRILRRLQADSVLLGEARTATRTRSLRSWTTRRATLPVCLLSARAESTSSMLQNGLIECASGFRIGGEAVPDHLVVEQIAALDIGVGTQNLVGDSSQLGVGPIAPRKVIRLQLGTLPELLQFLNCVRKGLVRVADDHGPEVSGQVDDQKRGDDDREKRSHKQPHLPTMRCDGFRKSRQHDLKQQGTRLATAWFSDPRGPIRQHPAPCTLPVHYCTFSERFRFI